MKYPLPLEIVKGRYPVVTQEFGDASRVAWYKANGVDINAHNGTDIIIGGGKNGPVDTYGTKLVCPFPTGLRNKVWYTEPLSTQGNGVRIQFSDERGVIKMLVWHCSECNNQEEYKQGDTLGYIGNSGLVDPKPTFANVHAGAHLHLGTFVNDVLCDPREIFDFTKWFISDVDTSVQKDLPPFQFFINKIRASLTSLFNW
jgi:murein DD-endopeptidase MepM/ murein hydrolase activator NlpD